MGVYGPGGSLGLQNRAGRITATGRFDSYTLPPKCPYFARLFRRVGCNGCKTVAVDGKDWWLQTAMYREHELVVFQASLGGCVRPRDITNAFREVARRAKIEITSFHELRHAAATWMLVSGMDVRSAAAVLGHSTASTTLGSYARAVASAKVGAVTAIDDRLNDAIM